MCCMYIFVYVFFIFYMCIYISIYIIYYISFKQCLNTPFKVIQASDAGDLSKETVEALMTKV